MTSARPLVHIGYHKTATTWFQKRFYPAVRNGVYVPRNAVQEAFLEPTAFRFDPEGARRVLARHQDTAKDWLILCEEELSGNVHSGGMRGSLSMDIAGRLRRTFNDAHVVVFIREQVSMSAALYGHYLREGGTHSPERYFFAERYRKDVARHPFKFPLFCFDHLDYAGLIRHYREVFGADRVHVFPYEAFREDREAFLRDYAARFGLDVPEESNRGDAENAGFGTGALAVARGLNRFTYRSVLDKRVWASVMSNKLRSDIPRWINRTALRGVQPTPQRMFKPATIRTIRNRFVEGNRWLAGELGLPLERYGYSC